MFKNNNTYKVLKIFLDSPTTEFRLREISRMISLAPASVQKYLKKLKKEKIISKENNLYSANRDEEKFKTFQKISIQYELEKTGLIDYLWKKICPEAIILFGSCSKGEATEDSDIDLFLITKEKEIDISEFEDKIKKEIQLFTNQINKIPKELKNNLINGIVLRGYFKVL